MSDVYRTLVFEQISDSRFQKDIAKEISDRKRKIIKLLNNMEGLHISHDVERKLSWPDGTEQFRCKFYIRKDGRKTTWNDVMTAVNSVHAVPYKFENWYWGNKEEATLESEVAS